MNNIVLLASFFILLISCSKTRQKEIHYIPMERVGSQVIINFNIRDGAPKEYIDGERLYVIPNNGILNTKFKENVGWFNENSLEFFLIDGEKKKKLPWNYNSDTTAFFSKYQNEIGIMGWFISQSTLSYVVDTVNLKRFMEKELYKRPDIFEFKEKE